MLRISFSVQWHRISIQYSLNNIQKRCKKRKTNPGINTSECQSNWLRFASFAKQIIIMIVAQLGSVTSTKCSWITVGHKQIHLFLFYFFYRLDANNVHNFNCGNYNIYIIHIEHRASSCEPWADNDWRIFIDIHVGLSSQKENGHYYLTRLWLLK